MLKKLLPLATALVLLIWAPSPSAARQAPILDVFITHDRNTNLVQVYFANIATGQSVTVQVENYLDDAQLLKDFQLAANGVIYTDPNSGFPSLISPSGNTSQLSYIPQSEIPPLAVDWVLSEDGRRIAWVELFFENNRWQSQLYVATLDGTELRQLPTPPNAAQPTLRTTILGLSNDGQELIIDINHPLDPYAEGQYFPVYSSLRRYIERTRVYLPIAQRDNCPCAANTANNVQNLLQLERPLIGNGYNLNIWSIESGGFRSVGATDTIYRQAGGAILNPNRDIALYSIVRVDGSTDNNTSAIVIADSTTNTQTILAAPPDTVLIARRFINDAQEAIVVDIIGNQSFKLNLESRQFDRITDKIWLGNLDG